jgi:S-adenosylmethionine-diacylglycerol 3-amino-3-carboxypropyl transferase
MKNQVQLSKLIFTHNWEDPAVEESAFNLKPGATIFTITSGGCNAIGMLRFTPKIIYALDINPAQNWLMELKQAAFRQLSYPELLGFIGIRKEKRRWEMYSALQSQVSAEARNFWENHKNIIERGIFMNGRYERFTKLAGALIRLLQGKKRTENFFRCNSLEEQADFYHRHWDNRRWRLIFRLMFNKKRLAKRGLNADYFHFDDGSASFSESFYRRAAHALTGMPIKSNYFLALYLLGHYLSEEAMPDYLLEKNFEILKQQIDKIIPVTADCKYWLKDQPADVFNAMGLSNICELMNDQDSSFLFNEVQRTGKPGARIVFRNLMIPREVPDFLSQIVAVDKASSQQLRLADRSFVYSKVAVYDIRK